MALVAGQPLGRHRVTRAWTRLLDNDVLWSAVKGVPMSLSWPKAVVEDMLWSVADVASFGLSPASDALTADEHHSTESASSSSTSSLKCLVLNKKLPASFGLSGAQGAG